MAGSEPVERVFQSHVSETKPITAVQQVYPSGETVPANLLRFYIQFSGLMERGRVWQYIQLLDRNDKPWTCPWNLTRSCGIGKDADSRSCSTPAGSNAVCCRAMRWVALVEGSAYTSSSIPSGAMRTVSRCKARSRKHSECRRRPARADLKTWRIQPPLVSSKDPLIVDFPAPLDYALLHRLLEVRSRIGTVRGGITVDRHETQWRFVPYAAWTAKLIAYRSILASKM